MHHSKLKLAAINGITARCLRAIAALALLLLGPASAQIGPTLMVYDFNLGSDPVSNVDQVRALGFGGLVTRCKTPADVVKLTTYASHVATLPNFQMLAYVDYDFNDAGNAQVWIDALPILASSGAPLWVIVKNAPTPAAVNGILLRMARKSQLSGVRTVVYPHWNTDIENAAEAAALIAQIGHPNLANSLHTSHEIRSGNQYSMPAVVAAHVNNSELVTIAGADANAFAGPPPAGGYPWDDAIQPLDRGQFDLLPFLQALHTSGYNGPVILHTFGITNDPGHLTRSLLMYRKYRMGLQ